MNFLAYSERLDYLLEMIEKGRITSPKQIAQKFDCCDKTARNMVNRLRGKGYRSCLKLTIKKSINNKMLKRKNDIKEPEADHLYHSF